MASHRRRQGSSNVLTSDTLAAYGSVSASSTRRRTAGGSSNRGKLAASTGALPGLSGTRAPRQRMSSTHHTLGAGAGSFSMAALPESAHGAARDPRHAAYATSGSNSALDSPFADSGGAPLTFEEVQARLAAPSKQETAPSRAVVRSGSNRSLGGHVPGSSEPVVMAQNPRPGVDAAAAPITAASSTESKSPERVPQASAVAAYAGSQIPRGVDTSTRVPPISKPAAAEPRPLPPVTPMEAPGLWSGRGGAMQSNGESPQGPTVTAREEQLYQEAEELVARGRADRGRRSHETGVASSPILRGSSQVRGDTAGKALSRRGSEDLALPALDGGSSTMSSQMLLGSTADGADAGRAGWGRMGSGRVRSDSERRPRSVEADRVARGSSTTGGGTGTGGMSGVDWRAESERWRESHRKLRRQLEDAMVTTTKRVTAAEVAAAEAIAASEEGKARAIAGEAAALRRLRAIETGVADSAPFGDAAASRDAGAKEFAAVEEAVKAARAEAESKRRAAEEAHSRSLAGMRRAAEDEAARLRRQRDEAAAAVRAGVRREAEAARELAVAHAQAQRAAEQAKAAKAASIDLRKKLRSAKRETDDAVSAGRRAAAAAASRARTPPKPDLRGAATATAVRGRGGGSVADALTSARSEAARGLDSGRLSAGGEYADAVGGPDSTESALLRRRTGSTVQGEASVQSARGGIASRPRSSPQALGVLTGSDGGLTGTSPLPTHDGAVSSIPTSASGPSPQRRSFSAHSAGGRAGSPAPDRSPSPASSITHRFGSTRAAAAAEDGMASDARLSSPPPRPSSTPGSTRGAADRHQAQDRAGKDSNTSLHLALPNDVAGSTSDHRALRDTKQQQQQRGQSGSGAAEVSSARSLLFGNSTPVGSAGDALAELRGRQSAAEASYLRRQLEEEGRLRATLEQEVIRVRGELAALSKAGTVKSKRIQELSREVQAAEARLEEAAHHDGGGSAPGEPGASRSSVVGAEGSLEDAQAQPTRSAVEERLLADLRDAQDEAAGARARERASQADSRLWRMRYRAENTRLGTAMARLDITEAKLNEKGVTIDYSAEVAAAMSPDGSPVRPGTAQSAASSAALFPTPEEQEAEAKRIQEAEEEADRAAAEARSASRSGSRQAQSGEDGTRSVPTFAGGDRSVTDSAMFDTDGSSMGPQRFVSDPAGLALLERELPEAAKLGDDAKAAIVSLPPLKRMLLQFRERAGEAREEASRARAARDRAVTRHADVLGAARVAVTDAAARKDTQLAALHEENRVLVQRLAETQTDLLRAQSRADSANADARSAAEAKDALSRASEDVDRAERLTKDARRHGLGAAKMHEALRKWTGRVMSGRLRHWSRITYKHITWREVDKLKVAERRSRQAELNAMAQEAEDARSALVEWAEGEVSKRSAEMKRRTERAEEIADIARAKAGRLEKEKLEARLAVGEERRKMAALRDRAFRVEGDNEMLTRAVHVATLRHAVSVCAYITNYHRSMRMGADDKEAAATTLRGKAVRERGMWRARVEAAAGRLFVLRSAVMELPGKIDELPDRDRALARMEVQQESADKLTKLKHSLEEASTKYAEKSHAEGVRMGALRAYEHKLREHASMSSVMESGAVDERHTRVAMRLEADVQVAAEKVAGARAATEAARAKFNEARDAMQGGLELIVAAKDEAIADMVTQWEAAIRLVGEIAATAASVRPVPADDVPFLLAGEGEDDEQGGGNQQMSHVRPGSREKHAAYEREAAEARRILARRDNGEGDFAALEDGDDGRARTAQEMQRMQSAATLTMVLEDRATESRKMLFGGGGGSRGGTSPDGTLTHSVPGGPTLLQTGPGSGLWTPQLTRGRTGYSQTPQSTAMVLTASDGSAGRATPKPRPTDMSDDPLLSTVARVFDAAAAASSMSESNGGSGKQGNGNRGGWDSGTWRPEQTASFKGMQQRKQAYNSRTRAAQQAKASERAAQELATALEANIPEAKLSVSDVGKPPQHRIGKASRRA